MSLLEFVGYECFARLPTSGSSISLSACVRRLLYASHLHDSSTVARVSFGSIRFPYSLFISTCCFLLTRCSDAWHGIAYPLRGGQLTLLVFFSSYFLGLELLSLPLFIIREGWLAYYRLFGEICPREGVFFFSLVGGVRFGGFGFLHGAAWHSLPYGVGKDSLVLLGLGFGIGIGIAWHGIAYPAV